ncbi:cysteine-rich protein [Cryptosporidium canis]|uniref:Cysteine-rich protein n=1 Tax=Cryptosporidium canis TaxID=195482 RepID=A0ABQ8P722_9CRYT|nr:cysteine-rich protein [Cryptosporidium canis]KAJ1614423.1 cysteine-rich protein [Cryptosporidium canis]
MPSSNVCSPATNANDENSGALITSGCKSSDCHCEGSGIVTSHTTPPNVTQKCYITNSGCHEAIVTTTTQEIRRHKCPPKIQKIHEHVGQPNYNCTPQVASIPNNVMMNSCQCNISRNSCCRTNYCVCSNGGFRVCCNRYTNNGCGCSCCCCSTSTVQTTLYPIYMSLPFNQGRSINVPYTTYSPYGSAYGVNPENQYSYQY